jgi:hypothetical protein
LHVCQACHLFLSIVCCVHLLSIVWWCSWVLQCLQISIFPCNIVMKKLSNMVLTLLSFLASCLLWSLILWCSYIKYKFLNTYRIECEFKNAWKKIKLEYICNWSSNNYSIGSMFPCLESNSPTMVSSSFCDTILLVLIIVTWRY